MQDLTSECFDSTVGNTDYSCAYGQRYPQHFSIVPNNVYANSGVGTSNRREAIWKKKLNFVDNGLATLSHYTNQDGSKLL